MVLARDANLVLSSRLDMTATDQQNSRNVPAAGFVESFWPSEAAIRASVERVRQRRPELRERALADYWAERVCHRYAAEGALTALPSVVPGLGTSAQLAIEGGTIAADLAYMTRCMAHIVMGVAHALGQEVERPFEQEFVRVVALWCGTTSLGREALIRVGTKVAVAQAKRVPIELLGRYQKRVAKGILTRLSATRGATSLGRLMPLGIGVLVGGVFNYATMRGFKRTVVEYYAARETTRS